MRAEVEAAFGRFDVPKMAELVGTTLLDDRDLVVVLRDLRTADLHRIHNDVEAIRAGVPADALDRLVGDLMTETLNYVSFCQYRGTDRWGVQQWDYPSGSDGD